MIYKSLGLFFFALGGLGIVVPLLPTVPLWLLAALFFARSAPHWQQRIFAHPHVGQTVRHLVEEQKLSRRSKIHAVCGSVGGAALSLSLLQPAMPVLWTVVLILAMTNLWIVTRKEPEEGGRY